MSISKVTAKSSNWPPAKMSWEVELVEELEGQDPLVGIQNCLLYNNLMYDLVGAVLGKLGWEYSKLMTGEIDRDNLNKTVQEIQKACECEHC